MKNKFKVGEIAYLTHGVREMNIQAVEILNIRGKTALVSGCGAKEFEVYIGSLITDRELIQEVFDHIKNTQHKN